MRKWTAPIAFLLLAVPAAAQAPNDLDGELHALWVENATTPKDEMIRRHVELAKKYDGHPDVATVYRRIASYYSIYDEHEEYMAWVDKALAHTKVGSDHWISIKHALAHQLTYSAPQLAKEILDEIAPHVKGNPLDVAELDEAYMNYYISVLDYDEAEKRCRKIFKAKRPDDEPEAERLGRIKRDAACNLVNAIRLRINTPRAVRIAILEKLEDDGIISGRDLWNATKAIDELLKHLNPDDGRHVDARPEAGPRRGLAYGAGLVVGAMGLVGVLAFARRRCKWGSGGSNAQGGATP